MADRHRSRARELHGGARHHHRQRRAALHCRRHGGERGRSVLGGHHLSRLQRHHPDGQQLPRPDAWPQDLLPDLSRIVHPELDTVRVCPESARAVAVSHPAGVRRRRHGAGRAIDPGGFLPAGKTRPGLRAVRRCRGGGAGGRPDARRLDLRQLVLAVVLSDQCTGRSWSRWH